MNVIVGRWGWGSNGEGGIADCGLRIADWKTGGRKQKNRSSFVCRFGICRKASECFVVPSCETVPVPVEGFVVPICGTVTAACISAGPTTFLKERPLFRVRPLLPIRNPQSEIPPNPQFLVGGYDQVVVFPVDDGGGDDRAGGFRFGQQAAGVDVSDYQGLQDQIESAKKLADKLSWPQSLKSDLPAEIQSLREYQEGDDIPGSGSVGHTRSTSGIRADDRRPQG